MINPEGDFFTLFCPPPPELLHLHFFSLFPNITHTCKHTPAHTQTHTHTLLSDTLSLSLFIIHRAVTVRIKAPRNIATATTQQRQPHWIMGNWVTSQEQEGGGGCNTGMLLPHTHRHTRTHTQTHTHTHLRDVLQSRRTGERGVMRWRDKRDRIRLVSDTHTHTGAKPTCECVGFHLTHTRFTLMLLYRYYVSHAALTQCVSTTEVQKLLTCF